MAEQSVNKAYFSHSSSLLHSKSSSERVTCSSSDIPKYFQASPWWLSRFLDNLVSAVFLLVHHCGSDWRYLSLQQPHNRRVLREKMPGRHMPHFQGSCGENPMILFWVLEISSSEIVCAKDAQSLWASRSGMLLPLILSQASLSLQYNQLLGSPCHFRTTNGYFPSIAWWHYGTLCILMTVRVLHSCGFDILGH